MNKQRQLSVSVIIPCYNEEAVIRICLEALSAQIVRPLEIIVVDNNCTDGTLKIAKQFKVKIIKEAKQGLIAARNTGFNVAAGDIIAKLDADSRPRADWVENMISVFESASVQAATGTGNFYDAPCKPLVRIYRNLFAVWLNRLVLGHHMLWGSNLALRNTAWRVVGEECCNLPDIMEDLDLAAHIRLHYGRKSVVYKPKMKVDISGRRAMVSLKRNWLYLKMWPRTLSIHNYERRILLWPAIGFLLVTMALANKYARFYNKEQERMIFSLSQWRSNPFYTRDNP